MDGHGETSIPPYNFVVGGIKTYEGMREELDNLDNIF